MMSTEKILHIESLSPLYEAVQAGGIFPDSKYFVDCIPASSIDNILAKYTAAKDGTGFDLRSFVEEHFTSPAEPDNGYSSADKNIQEHLSGLWNVLTRRPDEQGGTLIPLPYPYIVPGGRFREIYYWDSYFTMLGLQVSQRTDIIQNMVDNFAYLVDHIGFIPNGNRSYYLGRSQPPFFALMISLLAEEKGNEVLHRYLPQLEKEYAFWMKGGRVIELPDGSILNRYWDDRDTPRPEAYTEDMHVAKASGRNVNAVYRDIRAAAESGWDFSSRWFRDQQNMETIQTTALIPVDLNCLLFFMETLLASIYQKQDADLYAQMLNKANSRRKAIHLYCWDEEKGFFFDYQHIDQQSSTAYTLAAMYPLFCNVATKDQSDKVARIIENKFLHPGGVTTTLQHTGQQWDAPNGWAPLQWITYQGLQQYGHMTLAETIRQNWTRNNEKVFAETGKMMEKYNVTNIDTIAGGGEYPNQDGFGWTNGVYLAMSSKINN